MGIFSRLFGGKGKSTRKYEDIYLQARKMNQSSEYAFKQAVDRAVEEGVFATATEAADELFKALQPRVDKDDLPNLEKARAKIK